MFYFKLVIVILLLITPSCGIREPKNVDEGPQSQVPMYQKPINNEYIIVFKSSGIKTADTLFKKNEVIRRYDRFGGYHVKMEADRLTEIMDRPDIEYIEPNQIFRINTQQTNAPWGIDRIDARKGTDGSYNYSSTGAGVTAYILDTGVDSKHAEFSGRMKPGFSAVGGTPDDCHGHGTHVAGSVAGKTYGVAKAANIVPIRVLDCNGSGSTSGILEGLNWMIANVKKPAVANMSLGGSKSQALDDGVKKAIAAGITFAVAAGNESQDACKVSPANVPEAITVAASDNNDGKADFSNYGSCVDIFAPGVNITSAKLNGGSTSMSGTSMASPHIAGVAALFLQRNPGASPSEIWSYMKSLGTPSVISNPQGSPNLLAYTDPNNGGGGDTPDDPDEPDEPTEPTPTPDPKPTPKPTPGEPSWCQGECAHYKGGLRKYGSTTVPPDKPFFVNGKEIRGAVTGQGYQLLLWKTMSPYYQNWEMVSSGTSEVTYSASAGFYAWVLVANSGGNYDFYFKAD
jgi:subtilisin family serine protease